MLNKILEKQQKCDFIITFPSSEIIKNIEPLTVCFKKFWCKIKNVDFL